MTDYGPATEAAISQVVAAIAAHGTTSIIALSGVPGTGKSYIAAIAAQRSTGEPLCVRSIQFHRSYSYEEFVEGLRLGTDGSVELLPGLFLEWNDRALDDPEGSYIILIDELTRADVTAVLGEVMTYLEHRDRMFLTMYGRRPVRIANNIALLVTYNPTDRSALELDDALLRRMRILAFRPDVEQLREMLAASSLSAEAMNQLAAIFELAEAEHPETYEALMPFGHGIFSEVMTEADLYDLWAQRIRYLLQRPGVDPHPFKSTIEAAYPWRNHEYRAPADSGS